MEYRITLRPLFLNHVSSVPDPNWKNSVINGAEQSWRVLSSVEENGRERTKNGEGVVE